jgi:hypothetical protein
MLICTPCLLSATIRKKKSDSSLQTGYSAFSRVERTLADTTVKTSRTTDDKKKIKEIAKAKRQSKPEKVDEDDNNGSASKVKPKRQRRPAGLQRPPEIPRRNGN